MMTVRSMSQNPSYALIQTLNAAGIIYVFISSWQQAWASLGANQFALRSYQIVTVVAAVALFSAVLEFVRVRGRTKRRLERAEMPN